MARLIRIHRHGGPEVLAFEDAEVAPPAPGEVSLDVRAIGLNRSEVMFRNGRHIETATFPARLGYEAAGTVRALGADVSGLQVGDAVSLIPPPSVTRWGTYGEVATVPAEFVVRHPEGLSFVDAAATWMAAVTAYGGLIDIAGLRAGEAVVISAASSSVGLAAIQVANAIGAIPIATTRARAKRQAILDAGAHDVVVTEDEDLAGRILVLTGGEGARVVFDPVAGPAMLDLLRAMAQHGILIAYGQLVHEQPPVPVFPMIAKGLTYRGYTFKEVALDPARRERAKAFVLDGLARGTIRPVIDRVFHFEEMAEAHRYLESNAQFGKIVATIGKPA